MKNTVLVIEVKPNAANNKIVSTQRGGYKIYLKAHAVDGRANQALVEYLSEILQCSVSKIHLVKGTKSRIKKIEIEEETDAVIRRLNNVIR